jgi:hypothetical protein
VLVRVCWYLGDVWKLCVRAIEVRGYSYISFLHSATISACDDTQVSLRIV